MTAGDDEFNRPGPVDRDPLTEGWKPGSKDDENDGDDD